MMDNAPTYPRPVDGYGPPWMSEDEYLFSLRDVPEEMLDAAPEGMPEELWLAAVTEAELMPDPLSDVPGVVLARTLAEGPDRDCRDGAGGTRELAFFVDEVALTLTCTRQAAWAKVHTALDLVDRLGDTLNSLAAGRICAPRARIIAEGTRALTKSTPPSSRQKSLWGQKA